MGRLELQGLLLLDVDAPPSVLVVDLLSHIGLAAAHPVRNGDVPSLTVAAEVGQGVFLEGAIELLLSDQPPDI